jgi:D-alanyl-D-alanine carboxypeptidase/D-alanyl-D-alanine-endopeptidase (penicillin-binding protein 4)
VVLLLVFALASTSARASSTTLRVHLSHELALAGAHSGGYAYDITTKTVLFSERATIRRPPASVEKLYTAVSALERLGPATRFETTVLGVGQLTAAGTWEGDLYLRGDGDPTFGSTAFIDSHYGGAGASVSSLAEQLAKHGIRRISGRVYGDASYFDLFQGEPSSDYLQDPFLEGTLSALSFDRGQTGTLRGAHAPAAYAAHELWAALRSRHISVPAGSGAATTPPAAVKLAGALSPTVGELLALTLPPSDNFFAETLIKDLGARLGSGGTTAAGAAVAAQAIAATLGLHPHVVDGSGLSPADETSPYEVTDMLVELEPTPVGHILRADMAVAGRSGTLSQRMRHTVAARRCEGKTGTLTGVSNLAGYCRTVSGQLVAFAFFNDAISIETAHRLQDNMTISIADY